MTAHDSCEDAYRLARKRAELAEAEVERLQQKRLAADVGMEIWMDRGMRAEAEANNALRVYHDQTDRLGREMDLADQLAEALLTHECFHEGLNPRLHAAEMKKRHAALAAYEEARRD